MILPLAQSALMLNAYVAYSRQLPAEEQVKAYLPPAFVMVMGSCRLSRHSIFAGGTNMKPDLTEPLFNAYHKTRIKMVALDTN